MSKIVEFRPPRKALGGEWFIKSIDKSEDNYFYYLEIFVDHIPNVIRFSIPSIFASSELEAYITYAKYYAYHGKKNPEEARLQELLKVENSPTSESQVMRFK